MRSCHACGREFGGQGHCQTCPYCGFNTNPRSRNPRSKAALAQIEQDRREAEELEEEMREYFDVDRQ